MMTTHTLPSKHVACCRRCSVNNISTSTIYIRLNNNNNNNNRAVSYPKIDNMHPYILFSSKKQLKISRSLLAITSQFFVFQLTVDHMVNMIGEHYAYDTLKTSFVEFQAYCNRCKNFFCPYPTLHVFLVSVECGCPIAPSFLYTVQILLNLFTS